MGIWLLDEDADEGKGEGEGEGEGKDEDEDEGGDEDEGKEDGEHAGGFFLGPSTGMHALLILYCNEMRRGSGVRSPVICMWCTAWRWRKAACTWRRGPRHRWRSWWGVRLDPEPLSP